MSRVTAIICGILLFGLGLFLGMVGSFIRTLSMDAPKTPKGEPRAVQAASHAKRDAKPQSSTGKQPPPAVESALSQALAMVAVALAEQPATPAPPAVVETPPVAPPPAVPADVATNAPEQHPLDVLISDNATPTTPAVPSMEPPAVAPVPPPEPSSSSATNPLGGHWVFDRQLGWLWLPEHTRSVVVVPVIEVFPGGLITIHASPKTAASKTTRKNPAPPPRANTGTVTQREPPGSMRKPATSPFPNKE